MKTVKSNFLTNAFASGLYFCTPNGEVRSSARMRGFYMGGEKILKPYTTASGYPMVALCVDRKIKYYLVHQCMAHFFIRPMAIGEEVNHIDGDKLNNKLSNLEITTRKGNAIHAYKAGLYKYNRSSTTGRFQQC